MVGICWYTIGAHQPQQKGYYLRYALFDLTILPHLGRFGGTCWSTASVVLPGLTWIETLQDPIEFNRECFYQGMFCMFNNFFRAAPTRIPSGNLT